MNLLQGQFDKETGELAELAPNGLAAKQFPGETSEKDDGIEKNVFGKIVQNLLMFCGKIHQFIAMNVIRKAFPTLNPHRHNGVSVDGDASLPSSAIPSHPVRHPGRVEEYNRLTLLFRNALESVREERYIGKVRVSEHSSLRMKEGREVARNE